MNQFTLRYFIHGPYSGAKTSGMARFFGKYYWARRFYARLIRQITIDRGNILEIGCGFGDLLAFLEDDFHTVGIDVSRDAITEAKKRCRKTSLHVAPAEKLLEVTHGKFDTVVACHVFEHLQDPSSVLALVYRSLVYGGHMFFVVPNPESVCRRLKKSKWIGYRDATHISLYDGSRWLSLLESHGFVIEKTFSDGMWDSPYFPVIPTVIQRLLFGIPAMIQTLSTIPMLPVPLGESLAVIVRKPSKTFIR